MNNVSQPVNLDLLADAFAACNDGERSLVVLLQKAQQIYGHLPHDVIYAVAKHCGVSPAKAMGVATFYAQFRLKPVGKHLVQLCKGTACHVNGADAIAAALAEEGLVDGETTPDGLFSLKTVACLGCCSLSPVMLVDDDAYGSLTPAKAKEVIARIRAEETQKGDAQ